MRCAIRQAVGLPALVASCFPATPPILFQEAVLSHGGSAMLRIHGRGTRLCDGITRRELLRVGGLALGGLTLADVLRGQANAAAPPSVRRGKSVIMIWLRGGPSHIDSYDMKPDAPSEVRGEFSPIATNVTGVKV